MAHFHPYGRRAHESEGMENEYNGPSGYEGNEHSPACNTNTVYWPQSGEVNFIPPTGHIETGALSNWIGAGTNMFPTYSGNVLHTFYNQSMPMMTPMYYNGAYPNFPGGNYGAGANQVAGSFAISSALPFPNAAYTYLPDAATLTKYQRLRDALKPELRSSQLLQHLWYLCNLPKDLFNQKLTVETNDPAFQSGLLEENVDPLSAFFCPINLTCHFMSDDSRSGCSTQHSRPCRALAHVAKCHFERESIEHNGKWYATPSSMKDGIGRQKRGIKTCPVCGNDYGVQNYSRHLRTHRA